MQTVIIAILLFIAIWAWPVTLTCLGILILYAIIRAIYKHNQKKKRQAKRDRTIPQIRESLYKDRELLLSVIADEIKKHWHVLEDKFDEFTEEDDYGNTYLKSSVRKEFVYFGEKVILPELKRRIDGNETTHKNLTLILMDTTHVFTSIDESWFDIKFEDSSQVIAKKLLSAIHDSNIQDDALYVIYTDPTSMENYLHGVEPVFMKQASITLNFEDKLKTSEPMIVTPFVGLVFILFSAMHNNKSHSKERLSINKAFTGNDPYKYEEYIKTLLRSEGFNAKRTRGSGDYGVDVIASKNGKTYAIQCKLYNHTVGTKAVQEIVSGRIFYRADFAIVVSDNSFTDAAKSLARRSDVIVTHHKNLLQKMKSLDASEDETHGNNESDALVDDQERRVSQEPTARKQWTRDDTDELITVILPTINNDK